MPNPISDFMRRHSARQLYLNLDGEAADVLDALRRAADPDGRADLLYRLAQIEDQMSDVHPAAYGPDTDLEDRVGQASSIAWGADLARLIAATEHVLLRPALWDRLQEELEGVPAAERNLWGQLALTLDRRDRAAVIEQIAEQARGRIGGQAVEALYALASTERDVAAGLDSGRLDPAAVAGVPRRHTELSPWPSRLIGAALLLAAVALLAAPIVFDDTAANVIFGLMCLAGAAAYAIDPVTRIRKWLRHRRPASGER